MRPPRFSLGAAAIVLLGLGLPVLVHFLASSGVPGQRWEHLPLHVLVEGAGSIIAVALGLLLYTLERHGEVPVYHRWTACALLGMGVLDGFHALSGPGDSFIWLRSTATLAGGFLFAMVWLTERAAPLWMPRVVTSAAMLLGLLSLLFPEIAPVMANQHSLTPAARLINVAGSLCFLLAATRFVWLYRRHRRWDEFLFALHCTLFGSAGLLLGHSTLWDASWWWAHLLRLAAYGVMLRYMLANYQRARDVVSPYARLPVLIALMTAVAVVTGAVALHYVERRLVSMAGENLSMAAAEIADNLDRLLFERHGDVQMMARIFVEHGLQPAFTAQYLQWTRQHYPAYLWLGVTDREGRIVAATDAQTLGRDYSRTPWFQEAQASRTVHVGDVEPYEVAGGVDSIAFTAPLIGPTGEFLGAVTSRVGLPEIEGIVTRTIRVFEQREEFLGTIEYQFLTRSGLAFIDSDLLHKGNINLKQMALPSALLAERGLPGYVEEQHKRRHVPVVTGYAMMRSPEGMDRLRWSVLLRMDRRDILSPIRSVLWKLGTAGALVFLPLLGVLLWSVNRLQREWVQAQQESAHARAAEAALRESNDRFQLVNEATNDWIWDWNVQTNEVWWNDNLQALFGYPAKDVPRAFAFWYQGMHPEDRERVVASMRAALEAGQPYWTGEYRFRRVDGSYADVIDRARVLYAADGRGIRMIGSVRDITARKQTVKRQAAQLAVSRVLAESGPLGEVAPKLLQAICETVGWEVGAIWHVDETAALLRCDAVWQKPGTGTEAFAACTRGVTFAMGVGLPGRVWEKQAPMWIPDVLRDSNFPRAAVAAKSGLHGAIGFPILLGDEVMGVLEFFSQDVRPPDDELLHMMAEIGIKVGQFIQRGLLEEQLRQSQKMEAVGRLAGGIAHDFNNVLTVINGYSQLLLDGAGIAEPQREQMEEIRKAGERAAALTQQLLAFSRRQVLAPKPLDLNRLVADMDGLLRRLIGEHIELVTELSSRLGLVKADPSQMEQVIMNLVINARDAMAQGGRVTIRTTGVGPHEAPLQAPDGLQAGSYVMLAVSDTGCGMSPETQTHMFEPFFTTKGRGKGTGLGLATVYGIVKQSGGHILVTSGPTEGTTVRVYLPEDRQAAAVVSAPDPAPVRSSNGTETVLLVEDEDAIRLLLGRELRARGYVVLEADDGLGAMQLVAATAGAIHLLITDVVMPRLGGRELAQELAEARPDMKVLFMSGYTDDEMVRSGVLRAEAAFIQKPFTPEELGRKVREVLDAPRRKSMKAEG